MAASATGAHHTLMASLVVFAAGGFGRDAADEQRLFVVFDQLFPLYDRGGHLARREARDAGQQRSFGVDDHLAHGGVVRVGEGQCQLFARFLGDLRAEIDAAVFGKAVGLVERQSRRGPL